MPTVQSNNNINLFYESHGHGDAIVFAHEFGGDYRSWHKQIDCFKTDYHCITYSSRGFHPSSIPKHQSDYGQKQATSDLLTLFNALNLEAAHLVGTSMGSFTSLDFAMNYTDRVKTLTLIGNSSGPRTSQEKQTYRDGWVTPEIQKRLSEGAEGGVSVLATDPAYQNFRQIDKLSWDYYTECLAEQSTDGAINILKTLHWDRRSLWQDKDRLANLKIPVFLAYGDQDYYLVVETNRFLHEQVSNSQLQVFSETGHLVNIERAIDFNKCLLKHIQS